MDKDPSELTDQEKLRLYETALRALSIPELRSKIVGAVDVKNNRTYYNEKVGMELTFTIDGMLKDREEGEFIGREFPYQEFLENNGWSENTLFSYVEQGIAWLADHHPNPKYRKFKEETKRTRRKNDTGVRILWKDHIISGARPGGMFAFVRKVVDEEKRNDWKGDLIKWMSDPIGGKVFRATELSLTPEDKAYIVQLLDSSDGIFELVKLDGSEIKIGRKESE